MGAGGKTRVESRIKKFHATTLCLQAQAYNQYVWYIDTRKPVARFTGSPQRPAVYLREVIHTFTFESDEPGGRFECVLAFVAAAGTTSQSIQYHTLSNDRLTGTASFPDVTGTQVLRDGKYTFTVRPIDLAGNYGDGLVATWYLDTIAPGVDIVKPATHSDARRTSKDWAAFALKVNARCCPLLPGTTPVP